jgi:phosphoribosylglycinamide formyltransferase 2
MTAPHPQAAAPLPESGASLPSATGPRPPALGATLDFGAPGTEDALRVALLGSGELGKEVAIELERLGVETIAFDRYADAPAMPVSHRAHVVDMQDRDALRAALAAEHPALIVPEIEAIATDLLAELERTQPWPVRVVPTARATQLTMNREGIRRLAAEQLRLSTSPYRFVGTMDEARAAVDALGTPCVLKPVMSSSGKGQSVVHEPSELEDAWQRAQTGARGGHGEPTRCIVEGFVDFDYELTLLTVRHRGGVTFCDPIRHLQVDGDFAESWQGEPIPADVLAQAHKVANQITWALGGWGLFGVELFVRDGRVIFSEVSPRPHDTGLVTLVSQDVSEFALHVRAILGLPIDGVERFPGAAAAVPIKVRGTGVPVFTGVDTALAAAPGAQLRLFGKPRVDGERRVAVALARGADVAEARARARAVAESVRVELR